MDRYIISKLVDQINERMNIGALKKVMLFAGEQTYEIFSSYIELLKCEFDSVEVFFVKDSLYEVAVQTAKKICFEDYDLLIGLGGDKVLDTAKYAVNISKRKCISILTILSNDGISSPIVVLKTDKGKIKSLGCKIPDVIIIEIEVEKIHQIYI